MFNIIVVVTPICRLALPHHRQLRDVTNNSVSCYYPGALSKLQYHIVFPGSGGGSGVGEPRDRDDNAVLIAVSATQSEIYNFTRSSSEK